MSLEALSGLRPVYRRLRGKAAPVRVYERLYGGDPYGFLYESLEEHGAQGRFSFIGGRPLLVFRSKGDRIRITSRMGEQRLTGNPLHTLRELVQGGTDALPVTTFPGGAVGYFGYDVVRFLAPVPDSNPDDLELPDGYFLFPEEVVVFDQLDEVVHVLLYLPPGRNGRMDDVVAAVRACGADDIATVLRPAPGPAGATVPIRSNLSPDDFAQAVRRAKEYIRRGDILQAVLSQRFEFPVTATPLQLYRALRVTNPSPYMYHLNLDGLHVSGSSPEVLVKLTGNRVVTRPLAGTRPRGATDEEDRRLAAELCSDEKERAEHVMLVDLARNDIGRVCRVGSVRVEDYLGVERYSRVMHLVSHVTGRLRDDRDAFDLFESCFPAGTVSGAPKIRAMQIIDELETLRRGPYAGAIGYFSYLGDMDMCIAIRTLLVHGDRGFLQAGAGVVADSIPECEYRETLSKAQGLLRAVRLAAELETVV